MKGDKTMDLNTEEMLADVVIDVLLKNNPSYEEIIEILQLAQVMTGKLRIIR
jgi:hypothetical protein